MPASVQQLAGLAREGVLPHADHHHRVAGHGVAHFADDGLVVARHALAHRRVDLRFVQDRSCIGSSGASRVSAATAA
jgi:hypothetical protein